MPRTPERQGWSGWRLVLPLSSSGTESCPQRHYGQAGQPRGEGAGDGLEIAKFCRCLLGPSSGGDIGGRGEAELGRRGRR